MGNQKFKPIPVRLKELAAPLREEAMKQDKSLNWLICNISKQYLSSLKSGSMLPSFKEIITDTSYRAEYKVHLLDGSVHGQSVDFDLRVIPIEKVNEIKERVLFDCMSKVCIMVNNHLNNKNA